MARKTMEELATEWVLAEAQGAVDRFDRTRAIMEEMVRRCGVEHTNTYIDQARQTYRMLVL